jgi:hypothetical protein
MMAKTYVVDISSVHEVDEKTADDLQVQRHSTWKERSILRATNEEWLIEQVKKGEIYIVDIIGEEND